MDNQPEQASVVARLRREFTRIRGTGTRFVNPDGPEAADLLEECERALDTSARAFRLLEEVAVAQLEHDKARNFIKLGDKCRALLAKLRSSQ